MTINSANIRFATPSEVSQDPWANFKQSDVWKKIAADEYEKMKTNSSNYFLTATLPSQIEEWMKTQNEDIQSEANVLKRYPCAHEMDRIEIDSEKLIKKVLQHSRSGDFFAPWEGMRAIEDFLKHCYPDVNPGSFITSCPKEQTKVFHSLLKQVLQPKCVYEYLPTLRDFCAKSFSERKEESVVNITEIAQNFFIQCFGQTIFNDKDSGAELAAHLDTFKQIISKQSCGLKDQSDEQKIQNLASDVQGAIFKILVNNPQIFAESDLSKQAKSCLIFILLFAAQDNTTTLLSSAIWQLAKDTNEQLKLKDICLNFHSQPQNSYPEEINQFLDKIMQMYTPVPTLTRVAATDLCIEYRLESNPEKLHKAVISEGETVVARIDKVCQKNLKTPLKFGLGPHLCPGQHFAKSAIKEFIIYTLAKYEISLISPNELNLNLAFTINLDEDVKISLKPR